MIESDRETYLNGSDILGNIQNEELETIWSHIWRICQKVKKSKSSVL